jgi:uncharacterized cupredoxin-like copper-binding protein
MLRVSTRILPTYFAIALLSALALFAAACGGGDTVEPVPDPEPEAEDIEPGVVSTPPPNAAIVNVTLAEFSITPDNASVAAGPVYFLASNDGAEPHELVVIRSDAAPGDLPVDEDGRVPEDEVSMVGEIEPFAAGSDASIVFDLQPGNYVLICNIVEEEASGELESHYQEGMTTAFTVE